MYSVRKKHQLATADDPVGMSHANTYTKSFLAESSPDAMYKTKLPYGIPITEADLDHVIYSKSQNI